MSKFQVTEVQRSLKGFNYPGSAEDLANHAERNGADSELVQALRNLKKSDGFDGPNAVMHELSAQGDALGGPTSDGPNQRATKDIEGPAWQVTEVQRRSKVPRIRRPVSSWPSWRSPTEPKNSWSGRFGDSARSAAPTT